jgi:hypothetical protein
MIDFYWTLNVLFKNVNKKIPKRSFFISIFEKNWSFYFQLSYYYHKIENFDFLLSMNEVNIKYWFRNFQKKFFYRFSGRIRTFYRRKTMCTKKKIRCSAVCPEKFGSPLLPFPFNLETSAFGLVTDLVPNRSYWFLDFGNKFRRVAPIRIFGSFFTFSWNIDQFLSLIWCKILCRAQKSILYGV